MGFEKFYGFLGGETDQWAPLLVQDNSFIDTPARPGYHLTEDLVDRTIANIRDQQQANNGRPFFTYLALGANHAPLHAPKEFIGKYKGKFDQGWDLVRGETFARQKKLGIIPQNAQLTPTTISAGYSRHSTSWASETDSLYPMGWSLAGNTPFKKWKQDTHLGGNTDPFIVSWPAKIKDKGAIRPQYHHLVDVVPTILDVAGLPAPTSVNGVTQQPLPGVSMAYSFADGSVKTTKKVQYYEMLGSRAIWADGWSAVAWHQKDTPWENDRWELYHTDVDFTQNDDLAAKNPEKLNELIALWQEEAKKNNVLPLDDRRYERASDPGRPIAALARKDYTFYPGTSVLHPLAAPQLLGREHTSRPTWIYSKTGRRVFWPASAESSAGGASSLKTTSSITFTTI